MKFLNSYIKTRSGDVICGLTKELNVFCVLDYFNNNDQDVVVLTGSLYESNLIYDALANYTSEVCLFPMDDFLTSVAIAISPDLKVKRLETLDMIGKSKKIIVTNLMGYLRYLPNKEVKDRVHLELVTGKEINRDNFVNLLDKFGYKKESIVTTTGEFAVRGFVIDIFLIGEEHPIRIEFFGDEIESIRYFDENTQMSIHTIKNLVVKPYEEIKTDTYSSLIDYLNDPIVFKINSDQIDATNFKLVNDIFEYNVDNNVSLKYMYDYKEINSRNVIELNTFKSSTSTCNYDAKELINFNSDFDKLNEYLKKMIYLNKTVVICLNNDNQVNNILSSVKDALLTNENSIFDGKINIIKLKINQGFEIGNLIVIGAADIDSNKHSIINYKNSLKIGKKVKDFSQLSVGDYVVHVSHGIGIYNGVITLTKKGLKKDYVQINYKNNDKVYIPVEKISTIYKYTSKEGSKPNINQLGSAAWSKAKVSLKKKINDISKELIELYAQRAKIVGEVYKNDELEDMFDSKFFYDLTPDQKKAIKDINKDLMNKVPMDRLLCGDVGFGKTEVAFRAMFKAIVNNKQIFYLCPTTILSKQQYISAMKRFEDFPVNIGLLNRFTSPRETARILEGLENGMVDIVFGTHRLLSNDVKFKRLGLLVVDEEQRFGVTHKEKIKTYKNDVNVLTLSATPIPRTLKMALSGLRDLSVIDTPPVNRYPIQTYVMPENDSLIKDAIYKELSRKGQVFVLYNRVENIMGMVEKIKRLVPEARLGFAHGQMNKSELENIMDSFINYEFDILVCTTIIETGIDIQNANTLIVMDADRFGLSQLYQLRGRVGRSNKIAYAYLFYNRTKILNEIAVKRLEAIKEFTELGSGYRIAMRDLSIRGAGDLLGSEQAGFVETVGIELYMKMVDDEIKRLKGEDVIEDDEMAVPLINVDTHISDSYVSDEDIKIEIHSMINKVEDINTLVEIKNELEDRFGKLPSNLYIYMLEEIFEKLANKLNISKVIQSESSVEIELPKEISEKLKGDKLFLTAHNINSKFRFKYLMEKISIILPISKDDEHFLKYLIKLLEKIIDDVNIL